MTNAESWQGILNGQLEAKKKDAMLVNSDQGPRLASSGFQFKSVFLQKDSAELPFEVKAQLEHDTNKVTSGTYYYQSSAELNDIYAPMIISQLDNRHTTLGALRKVDASDYGDRYGVVVRDSRANITIGEYDESGTDAPTGGYVGRQKLQHPFVMYRAVPQISGYQLAAAAGRGRRHGAPHKRIRRL